ncbi:hypothetical protein KQI52_11280 [bacterium]|nr:hypothetical protein [bacterium]
MRTIRLAAVVLLSGFITANAAVFTVSPDGSGTYATIQQAMDMAQDGDVIELLDGVFRGPGNYNIDFLGKAVELRSQSGDAEACILDVNGINGNWEPERGLLFVNEEGPETIVHDITIMNADADGSCPQCEGGALLIRNSSPVFHNVIMKNNYAINGAGAFVDGLEEPTPAPKFYNCQFINNTGFVGVGVELVGGKAFFYDCIFVGNTATSNGFAAAVRVFNNAGMLMDGCTVAYNNAQFASAFEIYDSPVLIKNSIIAYNSGDQAIRITSESQVYVRYSLIAGNDGRDWPKAIGEQKQGHGNLTVEPGFVGSLMRQPVYLSASSACIDAGDPSSSLDPDDTRRDIGALYFSQVDDLRPVDNEPFQVATSATSQGGVPDQFRLTPLHPNPFNAMTTVTLALPDLDMVQLRVLDVLGRERALLHQGPLSAGSHDFTVNATDFASGIYFVVAESSAHGRQVQKAVLAK